MSEKRVPWGKVLQDHSPSSIAPGPPDDNRNRFPTVTSKKTEKRVRKIAKKLEKLNAFHREAPAPGSEWGISDVDKGTESQDAVGVSGLLSPESSPGSAGDGEGGEPSPGPDSLRARLVVTEIPLSLFIGFGNLLLSSRVVNCASVFPCRKGQGKAMSGVQQKLATSFNM